MTIEEVLKGYSDLNDPNRNNPERSIMVNELIEEAIKITMEINNKYHNPKEIKILMEKLIGKEIPPGFKLFPPFYTDFGKNIQIGNNVFINSGCHFQDQGGIIIGNDVLIGHNVVIATINHNLDPINKRKNSYQKVIIEDNVWLGSNVTILPGVKIGKWSVIAAGAVVTKDVPEYCVYGGVPAKLIKKIPKN